jgi:hypothetical protein
MKKRTVIFSLLPAALAYLIGCAPEVRTEEPHEVG